MSNALIEAGLKLASSKKGNKNIGTNWMDRTIYHTVHLEDAEGKKLFDSNGNPLIINTAYVTAGSYLSDQVLELALSKEKEFAELNKLFRDHMTAKGDTWRIQAREQTALHIQGVTG